MSENIENKKGNKVEVENKKENSYTIVECENKITANISEEDLKTLKRNDFVHTTDYLYNKASNKIEFCKAIIQFYLRLFETNYGSYIDFQEFVKINLNKHLTSTIVKLKNDKIIIMKEYVEIINLIMNVHLDIYDSQVKVLKMIKIKAPDLLNVYSKDIGNLYTILEFMGKIENPGEINFDKILLRLSKHLSQPGVFNLSKDLFALAKEAKTLHTFSDKLTIADIII
jgi:hypothetical protein